MKVFNANDLELTTEVMRYMAFDGDDGYTKPTLEQYENSKRLKSDISTWLRLSRKRQDELLDELFKERQAEKDYRGLYEAHKDAVRRYELYEEIENSSA